MTSAARCKSSWSVRCRGACFCLPTRNLKKAHHTYGLAVFLGVRRFLMSEVPRQTLELVQGLSPPRHTSVCSPAAPCSPDLQIITRSSITRSSNCSVFVFKSSNYSLSAEICWKAASPRKKMKHRHSLVAFPAPHPAQIRFDLTECIH